MIDNRIEPTDDDSSGVTASGTATTEEQRRLLELQLIKVRNEASAARLEARAAEIELMIRQLSPGNARTTSVHSPPSTSTIGSATPINSPHIPIPAAPSPSRFESWDEVRSTNPFPSGQSTSVTDETARVTRVDAGETTTITPHSRDADFDDADFDDVGDVADDTADAQTVVSEAVDESSEHADETIVDTDEPIESFSTSTTSLSSLPALLIDESLERPDGVSGEVAIESQLDGDEEEEQRRSKPAAWLVSAVAHVAVLVLLAAISLQTQRPKDQVALSATAVEANEASMETFSIESNEPEPVVAEPAPSETEYELSPVGQIAATDFAPDAPPAPPSPAAAALSSSAMSSSAAMSLKSDSDAKIQFCGVEGGGNHFVYLVDSSGSMGDGFESARRELLASIEILKPDQRFYVVFFDAESDYMRLRNPKQDESQSVNATPENKAALKRWAMRIAMDRGRAPYDPLRFALELKPDVIFLLSDGEFPQGIEDLLREENKVENLFGDSHPISIVHTISYHSKEGESRMRRIAEQNKGQYRYIPKP
jgi:hypothetical protein